MRLGPKNRWRINALACVLMLLPALSAHAQIAEVGDGGPGPVKAQHLTAELTSLSPQITPGGTQTIGLVLTIEEHWHVYWINAGDSGEPPAIKWTLPAGFVAGPLHFPPPQRLPLGPTHTSRGWFARRSAFPARRTWAWT
jgi:thiol:disulfide interchange protein DsbD